MLRCKILPPPTSTSSSPSSGKKWCAHNLYSLPLPSTLLLDNLSKIIFIFSHWSLYSSEICSPPASICSQDLSCPNLCSMLQIGQKKMNSRLFMFSLFDIFQQYLRLDQNIRWAGEGEMLHFALILLTAFDGFANLRFSKRRDQYIMTLRPHHLNEKNEHHASGQMYPLELYIGPTILPSGPCRR